VRRGHPPRPLAIVALGLAVCGTAFASDPPPPAHSEIPVDVTEGIHFALYLDPDPFVLTKEFTLFHNTVPDSFVAHGGRRDLFHLVYQRSGGPQAQETWFAHAWSSDLHHWVVDTLAFTVDTTAWNTQHVWSPSLVEHEGKVYLFYTGVDANSDQSIGYASTSLFDTTDTVWDPDRVQVLRAADTHWAVPDPAIYGFHTQFRDPYVMPDPDDARRLLMFYTAHDSIDFKLGRGGLAVGVARSQSGSVNSWTDLGYYASTLSSVTKIGQLEGPHAFAVNGSNTGWRLMFTNAGTPPGENGNTTIRFEDLTPGASVADTTPAHWGAPKVLKQYLNNDNAVYGWSGSEELHVSGGDWIAGFTAWGPFFQGIGLCRLAWNGSNFTIGTPSVTSVDEVHAATRGVRMGVSRDTQQGRVVTFELDSPLALEVKLEVFDAMGRRVALLLAGRLEPGHTSIAWNVARTPVASGVYFARLAFAGGVRVASIPIAR
jgi:sucrose-6-phosphate hydrolase SacC (GH32 family)